MGIKTESFKKDGKDWRRVIEDFEDEYGIIPKDFEFDGASAPPFLYPWVPPFENEEISARHDLDCEKAREILLKASNYYAVGNHKAGSVEEELAFAYRAKADSRYRKGMIKAKRASYKWKWRGNVVGSMAWVGVRTGSLFGVGWK